MIRLALRVSSAHAELALAELLELAPAGVEETEIPALDGSDAQVEYAIYGAPGELPALPDLKAAVGGTLVEITTSEVPDDWAERWKQFHRPVLIEARVGSGARGVGARGEDAHRVGARGAGVLGVGALHVRPPWEPARGEAGVHEIAIDPAQAFGTGAHATTRLCLELLLELAGSEQQRGALLDLGCGSGVLAIAAAKLGYAPVLALDNDRESVRATQANAAVNDVSLRAEAFDLRRQALPRVEDGPARVLMANLLAPLLMDLSRTLTDVPEHLIASGLLREQASGIAAEYAERHGLHEHRRAEQGEWAALWLRREAG